MATQEQIERKREKVKLVLDSGIGHEPSFIVSMPRDENRKSALLKALNWYSYIYTPKTGYQSVLSWVKENCKLTANEISAFGRGYSSTFLSTHYGLIKMIENGWEATEEEIKFIKTAVMRTVEAGSVSINDSAEVENNPQPKPIVPKVDSLDSRIIQLLTELDHIEDEWIKCDIANLRPVDLIQLMDRFEVKNATGIKEILGWINTRVEEYRGAADGTDRELVEGYNTRPKAWLKAVVAFLDGMKATLNSIQNQPKQTRVRRVVKRLPMKSAQISRVKYQKNDVDLNITSVSPSKIVGATAVWLFNSRYKFFTILMASQKGGFSISGTTIDGYDLDKSYRKVARNTKEMLDMIMNNSTKISIEHMKLLKTKPIIPNGRLNENTLILKVE